MLVYDEYQVMRFQTLFFSHNGPRGRNTTRACETTSDDNLLYVVMRELDRPYATFDGSEIAASALAGRGRATG
jgi:hypothetical protein